MDVKLENWTIDHFLTNRTACDEILKDLHAVKAIPSLNTRSLDCFKDGQLVRFRGMLQDMYNPEIYMETYQVVDTKTGGHSIRSGMYTDLVQCLPQQRIMVDSKNNKNSERQTCIVISIPGLNDWAKEKLTGVCETLQSLAKDSIKRHLDESEAEAMDCSEPARKKEKVSSTDAEAGTSGSKEGERQPTILSKEHMLNFPIPVDDGKACIVKIYDEESYQLNQILDIVGFLSLDPSLGETHDSYDAMDDLEKQTHNPPPSIIPRLHAIKVYRRTKSEVSDGPLILSKAECIRSDLHMVLSQLLFGDSIAADYLICHLISSIYMRKDCLCLGSFPLNITHFPLDRYKTFPKDLYQILSLLVEKSHYMEFTLEGLNDLTFVPKKDYECNRLTSGILQLSDHTHLVLDETCLTAGQVSASGKQNYSAVCDLVSLQQVTYDFKYYTMDYKTDIPILVLSEVKSFIPCLTQVILKPDPETVKMYPQVVEAAKQYLKDETRLSNIRDYLNTLKHVDFQFSDEIATVIQEDFVTMRQADTKFTADNLHSLMVLSRMMSLSHGSDTLTVDFWKKIVHLDGERTKRLPKHSN